MIKRNLIWIENIYDKFSLPYYFVSVIVSVILLFIFIIFHFMVPMLKPEFWYILVIVTMCSLIAFQQIAIIYILKCCRDTIRNLDFVSDKYFLCNSYYNFISIYNLKWIIPVNLLVIIPFLIIDILHYSKGDLPLFFIWMGTIGSLFLDLYNYFLSYLINYFISIQLFVNLSIVYLIRSLDIGGYKNYINLEDLETKNVKIAKLLSVSSAVYFLSLTLAIITYMGPFGIFTIQSVIYMALIFLGLLLFLIGRRYLGKIFTDRLKDEKDKLLNIDKPYYEKFVKISSDEFSTRKDELLLISIIMNVTNIQIEKLNNIEIQLFSFKNLSGLIIPFSSSVIAILIRMTLASELVNYFLSLFSPK